jgi:hypothetical protein
LEELLWSKEELSTKELQELIAEGQMEGGENDKNECQQVITKQLSTS